MNSPATNPLLFVSHKHEDKQIAERVAKFVRSVTGGRVDVFLSSESQFEGPRVGKQLNNELRDALWKAGVVLLVYTSQNQDWAWCMWECGLAEDPASPDTKVVVIQCLADRPDVFNSDVRVQAWEQDSVVRLAQRFTESDFFPDTAEAVSKLKSDEVRDRAHELHSDLQLLIPREPPENWSAWPFLRVSIERLVVDQVVERPKEERVAALIDALHDSGTVADSSAGLAQLFGRSQVNAGTPLSELLQDWFEANRDRDPVWLQALCEQMLAASQKRTPSVATWGRFKSLNADREYVIGVGRTKKDQAYLHFDCYFVGIGAAVGVVDRMTRRDKMFYINLAEPDELARPLLELVSLLERNEWSRVPILDGDAPRYIVHVSMIDRYVRCSLNAGIDTSALTLGDLLADPEMKRLFESSFGTVSHEATIADALLHMRDSPHCEDVYVLDDEDRVVGWLTDRDIPADALRVL